MHNMQTIRIQTTQNIELEYELAGKAPVTLGAGESLFIPAGAVHSARNVGPGPASELATYFVERGKPLVVLAPLGMPQRQ